MARLVINVPDEELQEFIEFICEDNNYPVSVPDPDNPAEFIPNTYPKPQFAREALTNNLKNGFDNYKRFKLAEAAAIPVADINVTSES